MSSQQCFFILHEGRCGSTVLADMISQHPKIVHYSEILTPNTWISEAFERSGWQKQRDARAIRLPDLCAFVRELPEHSKTSSFAGLEIKFNQLSFHDLDCDLKDLVQTLNIGLGAPHFVFLTRRNALRRHVSTLRCLLHNVTHNTEQTRRAPDKVTIAGDTMCDFSYDFDLLHPSLTSLLEFSDLHRCRVREYALNHGHLYLEYEDFEHEPLYGAERIFDHLGIPPIKPKSRWTKPGDFPLADLVSNYSDVSRELSGTRWEFMLDDACQNKTASKAITEHSKTA